MNLARAPVVFTIHTEVEVWLARFSRFARSAGVMFDHNMINLMASYLDDETYKIVENAGFEHTWEGMHARIKALFGKPNISTHPYLQKFINRTQNQNENIVQYASALMELAKNAFPSQNRNELDALLCEQLITGLKHRSLSFRLKGVPGRNFNIVVQMAREFEAADDHWEMNESNQYMAKPGNEMPMFIDVKPEPGEPTRSLQTPRWEAFQQRRQSGGRDTPLNQQWHEQSPQSEDLLIQRNPTPSQEWTNRAQTNAARTTTAERHVSWSQNDDRVYGVPVGGAPTAQYLNANEAALANNTRYNEQIFVPNRGTKANTRTNRHEPEYNTRRTNAIKCHQCGNLGHMRRDCPYRDNTLSSGGNFRENSTLQVPEMYRLCYNNSGSGTDSSGTPSIQNASNQHPYDTKTAHQSTVNEIYNTTQTNGTNVFVDGEVGNVKFRCLVDTGSQKTIVNENIWNKIKSENQKIIECGHALSTANGQPLNLVGATRVNLKIGHHKVELEILIVRDLRKECILGLDYLDRVPVVKEKLTTFMSELKSSVTKDTAADTNVEICNVGFSEAEDRRMEVFLEANENMFAKSI